MAPREVPAAMATGGGCPRCGRAPGALGGSCGLCGGGRGRGGRGAEGDEGGSRRQEALQRLARDYAGWTGAQGEARVGFRDPGLDRLGTLRSQVDELHDSIEARLRVELRAGAPLASTAPASTAPRPASPYFQARGLRSSMDGLEAALDNRQVELAGISEAQRQSRDLLRQLTSQVEDLRAEASSRPSSAGSGRGGGGEGRLGVSGSRGRILEPGPLRGRGPAALRSSTRGPDVPELEEVAAAARRAAARAVVAAEAQARPGRMLDRLAEGSLAHQNPAKLDRLARELVQRYTAPVEPVAGGAEDACCICLEPLERDLRMLPCGHRLHGACMQRWLWGKPRCVCPLCKRSA